MVDGSAAISPDQPSLADADDSISAPSVRAVVRSGEDALRRYATLCENAAFAPAQSAIWVANWVATVKPDWLIVFLESGPNPLFALPLEIAPSGPFRVAQFMGGRHANANFPAARRDFLAAAAPAQMLALAEALRAARSDIDLLSLDRQMERVEGSVNPFCELPCVRSPNLALAADLDGGFEALLDRANGKRKRKKYRAQTRKFEAAGGYRRIGASNPEEVDRLLSAFFAMKEERFRKAGISNVFAEEEIRRFFRGLFQSSLEESEPSFVLHGLEVGGILRAITGSSRCGKRLTCEFGAISEDELASTSPGEFLFFENIREACGRGFTTYDFGVGDEPYKRSWCNVETTHFDTVLPLTARGRLLALGRRGIVRAKRALKSNRALWTVVKQMRKKAKGPAHPEPDAG